MVGRGIINRYERQIEDAKEEKVDLEKELAQIKDLLSPKGEIEKQAEMIRKVTRRLPSSSDAPGFLNTLMLSLRTTGIIQEEVKPETTSDESRLYTEIPYKVKALGHYHAFGQFLTLIEQNPERFMRVKNMTISNSELRPSIHPFDIEIETFIFNN